MSANGTLLLNLASRPARNRRFYLLSRAALAAACVILLGLAAFTLVKYGLEARRLNASLAEAGARRDAAAREERRLRAEVRKAEAADNSEIEVVNRIIFQKSFSWTRFFSELEAALPDSAYITALTPNFSGERTVTLKVKVVSAGLDDLLVFLNNLSARKFACRVESDSRDDEGRLVSEISLSYERVI
jgi:Tfp pilus assembly protein PilN